LGLRFLLITKAIPIATKIIAAEQHWSSSYWVRHQISNSEASKIYTFRFLNPFFRNLASKIRKTLKMVNPIETNMAKLKIGVYVEKLKALLI